MQALADELWEYSYATLMYTSGGVMAFENLKMMVGSLRRRLFGTDELEVELNKSLREVRDAMNFQFEQTLSHINSIDTRLGELAKIARRPANAETINQGNQAKPPKQAASNASIFRKFGPEKRDAPAGYHREFGGNIYSQDVLTPSFSMTEEGYPSPSEELFEWIDLLESIDDATDSYVMAELGAGFGRWLGAAACLIRKYKPMPFRFIGAEAEPVHFEWTERYFSDNDLNWREHHLVQAAVGEWDGFAEFVIGNPREWYGQAIAQTFANYDWNYADRPDARVVKVPMVSIETLLKDEHTVDYVHMDIQGSEADVVASSHRTLSEKVRRIHIATHHPDIEQVLYNKLRREGWWCTAIYPGQSTSETPYGPVAFGDGVQSWVNPRLFKKAAVNNSPKAASSSRAG